MINKKILIVASYPVVNPRHGGQKRAKAIYDLYKRIFQNVKFVAVYHRVSYEQHGDDDLLVAHADILKEIEETPSMIDMISGKSIDKDIHVRSPMAKLLIEYKPEIIQVEQPYCYLGLKPLLKELNLRPKLILSSHNIEFRMKEEIYKGLNLSKHISQPIVQQIKELETVFSRDADLVIAVSEEDAKEHYKMGAKRCVIAPNGIERMHVSESTNLKWQNFNKRNGVEHSLVFVGSAHPPNWMGFLEVLGEDLSFLPEGSKILLVGGVSEYFSDAHTFSSSKAKKQFNKNTLFLGKLSDDDLAGVIAKSEIILLPITGGGGSNLKTAEAILSGRKIVGTNYAFRSFENYSGLPNVYIAKNQRKFRGNILKALSSKVKPMTYEQKTLVQRVQWKHTLSTLEPALKRVSRTNLTVQARRVIRGYARKVKSHTRRILRRG